MLRALTTGEYKETRGGCATRRQRHESPNQHWRLYPLWFLNLSTTYALCPSVPHSRYYLDTSSSQDLPNQSAPIFWRPYPLYKPWLNNVCFRQQPQHRTLESYPELDTEYLVLDRRRLEIAVIPSRGYCQ